MSVLQLDSISEKLNNRLLAVVYYLFVGRKKMTINVKLVGAFRHFSGADELEFGFKKLNSVGDLVTALIRDLPNIKRTLIYQQLKKPVPNALILVNGKEIGVLDGVDTKLKDGDEVVLVPVVHGG